MAGRNNALILVFLAVSVLALMFISGNLGLASVISPFQTITLNDQQQWVGTFNVNQRDIVSGSLEKGTKVTRGETVFETGSKIELEFIPEIPATSASTRLLDRVQTTSLFAERHDFPYVVENFAPFKVLLRKNSKLIAERDYNAFQDGRFIHLTNGVLVDVQGQLTAGYGDVVPSNGYLFVFYGQEICGEDYKQLSNSCDFVADKVKFETEKYPSFPGIPVSFASVTISDAYREMRDGLVYRLLPRETQIHLAKNLKAWAKNNRATGTFGPRYFGYDKASGSVTWIYPFGSRTSLVQVVIDRAYADTFTYSTPTGQPAITQFTAPKITFGPAEGVLKVRNVGNKEGVFSITVNSKTSGIVATGRFAPSVPVNVGQEMEFKFDVYSQDGLNKAYNLVAQVCSGLACVSSEAQGSVVLVHPPSPTVYPHPTFVPCPALTYLEPTTGLCKPVPSQGATNNDVLVGGLFVVGGGLLVLLLSIGKKRGRGLIGSISFLKPLVIPTIIAIVVWYVVQFIELPFVGRPFAGVAPLVGVVVGLFAYLVQTKQVNVNVLRMG